MCGPAAATRSIRASCWAWWAFGALVFVALLWMIGSGHDRRSPPHDGGGHVGGKGLNGYAGLADLLERRGYTVERVRSAGRLDDPGLLVLTPPHMAEGCKARRDLLRKRRMIGPTLLILPKWQAAPADPAKDPGAQARAGSSGSAGRCGQAGPAAWMKPRSYRSQASQFCRGPPPVPAGWDAGPGWLRPAPPSRCLRGASPPLVRDGSGQMLAAYLQDDGGDYPGA